MLHLYSVLFLCYYERGLGYTFTNLNRKHHDLRDMFNDTSRYIDYIFTIINPEFEKHIADTYPAELRLKKEKCIKQRSKREVPRGVRNSKVRRQDKFRRDRFDIRTHASPKVGQDQVSGGVSVLCGHAAPVAYVLWKPCTIR